jgi:hypothetical protein
MDRQSRIPYELVDTLNARESCDMWSGNSQVQHCISLAYTFMKRAHELLIEELKEIEENER